MTNFGKVKNFVKVHVNDQEHVLALKNPMDRSEVKLGNLGRSASSHAVPLKPPLWPSCCCTHWKLYRCVYCYKPNLGLFQIKTIEKELREL